MSERGRGLTRYLEDTGGDPRLPESTAVHILSWDDNQDGEVPAIVLTAQKAVDLSTQYVATARWDSAPFRYFRDLPWTEFPVVDTPHFSPRNTHRCTIYDVSRQEWVRPITVKIAEALRSAPVVFLHMDAIASPQARLLLPILEILSERENVQIYWVDASGVHPRSVEQLRHLCSGYEPLIRFEYNYAINFRAIAGKALVHALRNAAYPLPAFENGAGVSALPNRIDPESRLAARLTEIEAGYFRGLDDPILLQALYRIRRLGNAVMAAKEGSAVFREVDGEWYWDGLGRQPLAPISRIRGLAVMSIAARPWLIGPGQELHLTAAGEMFLDLLHPDCEDANLLCRWRDGSLSAADSTAMDRWILSKFRKMKTRVNLLRDVR